MLSILQFVANHPFNADNKLGALLRFAHWQLGALVNRYPVVYPFTENSKLIVWKGLTGATQNVYCGLHEFQDMGFLLHFLRPGDLFVDVGANIGSYTVLASAEAGASTISIEPVPSTFQNLRNNVSVNAIHDRVALHNIGVGSQSGQVRFTHTLDTINHVATPDETDTIDVPIDTLDHLLANQQPVLIKIDVEGFETEVLNGATRVLQQPGLAAVIIELNGSGQRYDYNEAIIHDRFLANGFTPYQYDPFSRRLTQLASYGHHNTIYIRNVDQVLTRLQTARQIGIKQKRI